MDNNHYRYCFSCDKWKTKSEINEVDLGGDNKSFNCNVCRKDLGETCQIFRCKKHNEEILKVWGTCEGENKEKIFFDKCPQEKKEEREEQKPTNFFKSPIFWTGTSALVIMSAVIAFAMSKKPKEEVLKIINEKSSQKK